jgi:flagellar biosynthesis/type III secretory pathway protein FliH
VGAHNKNIFFGNLPDFEKEAEEAKRLAKMPKQPSFSLQDMEDARKAAHEKGRLLGLEQAKNTIEQQTEILVQSLTIRIHELEEAEMDRNKAAISSSIAIATKALEKLIPAILEQEKENLIKQVLTDFFQDHIHKTDLILTVHPEMQGPMEKYCPLLHPNLKLEIDEGLSPVQARLEWQDGVFEFTPDTMMASILNILGQYGDDPVETLDDTAQNTHTKEIEVKETDNDHE